MSDANGSALKENISATTVAIEDKGKGKAAAEPQDESMDVDDSSSDDEVDEVSFCTNA